MSKKTTIKRPAHRPSIYSEDLVDKICDRLAEGEAIRNICKEKDMPSWPTIRNWLNKYPYFLTQYARAREEYADVIAEEVLTIADTEEDMNRARVRIDARKWTASKLNPKRYGNRVAHVGPDDGAIQTEEVGDPADEILRQLEILAEREGAAERNGEPS